MATRVAAAEPMTPGNGGREGGFLAIHRRLRSSALFRSLSAEQRSVFFMILLLANRKDGRFLDGGDWVVVHRGELAHSLATLAAEAAVSVKVVRTTLKKLMADDSSTGGNGPFLTGRYTGTESGTGLRILRVEKYAEYQDVAGNRGTDLGRPMGTAGARQGHASGTAGAPIEPIEPIEPPAEGSSEPAPPASEPPSPRRLKGSGDPRHAPVVAMLVRVYEQVKGTSYGFQGVKDAKAVSALLALGTDEEIEIRWRRSLARAPTWPGVATIAALPSRWNELTNGAAGAGAAPVSKFSEYSGPIDVRTGLPLRTGGAT